MRVFLSHTTALEAWRCWSASGKNAGFVGINGPLPTSPRPRAVSPSEDAVIEIVRSCQQLEGKISEPIHVLVSYNCRKRSGSKVFYHRTKLDFPNRPFRQLTDVVSICSPELTFSQLAGRLSLAQLISVGFEMCGNYPIDGERESGSKAVKRQALTSAKELLNFTDKATGARGRKVARRAAAYVIDGSASPMETAIAMELSLPYALGGRGLPKPLLNYKVELDEEAATIARRKHLVFDLFWPEAMLAVEYDSKMHHEGETARIADSQKRDAATSMGIQVISITERQFLNMLEFEEIAKAIAYKLGRRIRPTSKDYPKRVFRLRAELKHLYSPK